MVKEADVHLSVAKNPRVPQQTAEVTIFASGAVIRAQERSENLYASIDLVASKLSRQLRKYKERHHGHHASHGQKDSPKEIAAGDPALASIDNSLLDGKQPNLPAPGIKRKYFSMKPMCIEEALHQLELIDHDFYLFREKESMELQVIYKRNHGGFGVIQSKN